MQGTQYAPRESILCMEHFVALQSTIERSREREREREITNVRYIFIHITYNDRHLHFRNEKSIIH